MKVYSKGNYSVIKDSTSWYRVLKGRKRVGSFRMLQEASDYADMRHVADGAGWQTATWSQGDKQE